MERFKNVVNKVIKIANDKEERQEFTDKVKEGCRDAKERLKDVRPSRLTQTLKGMGAGAIGGYMLAQQLNSKPHDTVIEVISGAAVGAAMSVIQQEDFPLNFTIEIDGDIHHLEISGNTAGNAQSLEYIANRDHTLRYIHTPGHTTPHEVQMDTDEDAPALNCSKHKKMSLAQISAIAIKYSIGNNETLSHREKIAEHIQIGKWNVIHLNRIHDRLHGTREFCKVYAYCSTNTWTQISNEFVVADARSYIA